MIKRIVLAMVLYSFANCLSSFAQESIHPDSLSHKGDKVTTPVLPDSSKLRQNKPPVSLMQPEIQGTESLFKQQRGSENYKSNLNDTLKEPLPELHPKFKPYTYFDIGATRWSVPVIGDVTTFSPGVNYQAAKNLSIFGGVNFSQYHNLSWVQNVFDPGLPAKSNITADAYIGASYRLFDIIILHGSYQRSLYNQLPGNMMMFAPGQNVVVTGASLDLYHGLGVTVDHVWEFDRYGHFRQGFRYSPYLDIQKFIKFLKDN
jgi:hypothetical protein